MNKSKEKQIICVGHKRTQNPWIPIAFNPQSPAYMNVCVCACVLVHRLNTQLTNESLTLTLESFPVHGLRAQTHTSPVHIGGRSPASMTLFSSLVCSVSSLSFPVCMARTKLSSLHICARFPTAHCTFVL